MKHFAFLLVSFFSSFALGAEDIQVWGRTYDYSCGYFSRRTTDLSVTLKNDQLPFGTEVNLVVGYGGDEWGGPGVRKDINWADRTVVAAKAIDKSTWEAKITDKTLHSRTDSRWLLTAQFVFEIKIPGEAPRYQNGGSSWGYYQTERLTAGVNCVRDGKLPEWGVLKFDVVKKD